MMDLEDAIEIVEDYINYEFHMEPSTEELDAIKVVLAAAKDRGGYE